MNYQQVNYLMDVIMPKLEDTAAFSIAAVIARNTWGRSGTEWVELSYKDFKTLTGIQGVNTIKRAIEKAGMFIEKRPKENQGFEYRMKAISIMDIVPVETVSEMDISKTDTVSKTDIELYPKLTPPVSKTDIVLGEDSLKEEERKEKEKNNTPPPPKTSTRKGPPTPANEAFPFLSNGRNPEPTPADLRTLAILEVCGLDSSVPKHASQAEAAAAQLSRYTAGYIKARYGQDSQATDDWQWYCDDFRGREGQQPSISQLVETIAKKRGKAARASKNGNHVNEEFTADAIKNRLKQRKEGINAVA